MLLLINNLINIASNRVYPAYVPSLPSSHSYSSSFCLPWVSEDLSLLCSLSLLLLFLLSTLGVRGPFSSLLSLSLSYSSSFYLPWVSEVLSLPSSLSYSSFFYLPWVSEVLSLLCSLTLLQLFLLSTLVHASSGKFTKWI